MDAIRILLADDHAIFRRGLATSLAEWKEFEVVGEAGDGTEAIEKAKEFMPDLILMDVYMPGCNGLEAARRIKEELPCVKVVMLTVSEDDQTVFEAIKSGAEGYVIKNVRAEELVGMLRGITRGEAPISRSTAGKILREFARRHARGAASGSAITLREQEVLDLVAKGHANKEIAGALHISENTVKKHLRNILEKLHLRNRVEAAIYALEKGMAPGAASTAREEGPS